VLALMVKAGAPVTRGQRVALIEAMKMEHTLTAPSDGTVADVAVKVGDQVAEGATVLRIDTEKHDQERGTTALGRRRRT
jgi:3-methylcrotonyl-CoA carboxylase alpha subunit